jgi:hypothetical protein
VLGRGTSAHPECRRRGWPVYPIPADLWRPPADFVAPSGSYVYFKSDGTDILFTDYIGQGKTHTYTQADAVLRFSVGSRTLNVSVEGDEYWYGRFMPMSALDQLAVGYYPGATRYLDQSLTPSNLNDRAGPLVGLLAFATVTLTV